MKESRMPEGKSCAELRSGTNPPAVPPVGPTPSVDDLLVGSLLYGDPCGVLDLVHDDDLADPPTSAVLATIRTLADRAVGPQLVLDDLMRRGEASPSVRRALITALTAGAALGAAGDYAAAALAEALRRKVESFGHALQQAADSASEAELGALIAHGATECAGLAARLNAFRGGVQ
jgi:hypothetical protein